MSKTIKRLETILESIESIEFITSNSDIKITKAINDKILKPAIRMHIVKIAEQFLKLKNDNEFEVLEHFSKDDLRGISAVRNYIAHDYDSVDDEIIEDVIRYNMPKIKKDVVDILSKGSK